MEGQPIVSVIVPLYQKGPYIERTLSSIFSQTVREFELIVIDDGSTDDGPAVLAGLNESRLVVRRQLHSGVSAARNHGIALARAEWVAFLDADDEWAPDFLASTLKIATTHANVIAVFSNILDHRTGEPLLGSVDLEHSLVRDYFASLLDNSGVGMSSSSVLVRKAVLKLCGDFRVGVARGQDTDLWARLAWSGEIGYCERPLATYHSEVPGSVSKCGLSVNVDYPALLETYELWADQGRIPGHLAESSRRYATWMLARHVIELAHIGAGAEGRRRLDRAPWRTSHEPLVWRARLWTRLPAPFLRFARRVRRVSQRRWYRDNP